MTSVVDIVNLALSHISDPASVASIDPPEATPQARAAARFYPVARDNMLSRHCWGFATRRQLGQLIASPIEQWACAYAVPSGALNVFAVLSSDAQDSYSAGLFRQSVFQRPDGSLQSGDVASGVYTPCPFEMETLDDGTRVVYTNQEDALLRYTVRVTDPTKFSPLFVTATSYLLASYLAGPLVRGEAGASMAKDHLNTAEAHVRMAAALDTKQRNIKLSHSVPWMAGR